MLGIIIISKTLIITMIMILIMFLMTMIIRIVVLQNTLIANLKKVFKQ